MSWLGRVRALLADPCTRCSGPTVVMREELLSTVPAVFEVLTSCSRCGTTRRRQVVDSIH